MKNLKGMKMIYLLIAVVAVIALYFLYKKNVGQEKISEFGKYPGYTEKTYDGTKRVSDYLALPDGTRLAYDLFLPTEKGIPADKPLPVLFKYTPYLRTFTVYDKNGKSNIAELEALPWHMEILLRIRSWVAPNGNLMDALFRTKWLGEMVKSGYAVVVVERSGTGASFGKVNMSHEATAKEVDEILNWIAAQKWCDGNIGMYGDSWQAQVQFVAASTGNPHLKAIMPASTWMDTYSAIMYPGGVYDKAFGSFFVWSQKLLDSNLITPVDRDKDGALMTQARAERRTTVAQFAKTLANFPFRDSATSSGIRYWDGAALLPYIDRINQSGIPVYLINGWYDLLTRDNFVIYANLTVPRRLLVRPTDHSNVEESHSDIDYGAEAHRWFDYWLKGIDNGIMKEPPIHYYLISGEKKNAWKITDAWPLKNQKVTRYYFGAEEVGRTDSINNGTLVTSSPTVPEASDTYTVDYTTTTGKNSRWTAVTWAHKYPNLRSNDAKSLTYTTLPLETSLQVIGHPVLHVWLSSGAPDLDVFVYLEEVDASGDSTYITEGNLRASHRALAKAPYNNLGLPYHSHLKSDQKLIPAGEPVELVFDLLPTAYQFGMNNRIRITVAFADADNFDTPVINPAPKLRLLRDMDHPSSIELPIVQSR